MKNIVGQTPRGSNFYHRQGLLDKLYERLENNAHLYMAAPRRMGKTAIMRYLEDHQTDNFCVVYVITESADNSEQFCRIILEELYKSTAVTTPQRLTKTIREFLSGIRISLFEFFSLERNAQEKYHLQLQSLLQRLSNTDGDSKLLIMLDEFPQTVENILRKTGEDEAINFLHLNHELRQQANEKVLFLITGSTGLPALVDKLNATNTMNDLSTFEIPPLTENEAQDLLRQLLTSAEVPYQDSDLALLLNKLEWFSPYYIQLLAQELSDQYDLQGATINEMAIDKAFRAITDRRNDMNFAHYYSRLQSSFAADELAFALAVLEKLCQQTTLNLQDIQTLAQTQNLEKFDFVLRALEFDGYIFKNQHNEWRFISPILKLWWAQYVNARRKNNED